MPYKTTQTVRTRLPGIVQDGPDRYLVRARWTDEKGRRRKREGVAKSFEDAVVLQAALRRGDEVAAFRPTRERLRDYVARWLREIRSRLAESTIERYTVALGHVSAAFGQCYVDALSVREIREWVIGMSVSASAPTVNGRLRVLRQALEPLVDDGIIASNPARKVRALPEGRTKGKRGAALTAVELRKLVDTTRELTGGGIAEDVARMILVLAFSGVRRSECLALKWSDWVDGELRIERAVWKRMEKTTKTDDPRRVAVVGPLVAVLSDQKAWLVAREHPGLDSGLIFPARPQSALASVTRRNVDEVSWFRTSSVFDKPLARVVKAAGVTPISAHSFRRTWENMLRQAGVDGLVRRSMAGWRTDEAQAIYATVDRRERDEAAQKVVTMVMGKTEGGGVVRPAGTPEAKTKNAR